MFSALTMQEAVALQNSISSGLRMTRARQADASVELRSCKTQVERLRKYRELESVIDTYKELVSVRIELMARGA